MTRTVPLPLNEDECNCGLLVGRDVFSLLGLDLSYEELKRIFISRDFHFYDFGITSVHVAFLIRIYNFDVTLRTPSNWLKKIYDCRSSSSQQKATLSPESLETFHVMNEFLEIGGNLFFTRKNNRPNLNTIITALDENRMVVACINARDYYGIEEDWNHYVLLSKSSESSKNFVVTDSLKVLGHKYYQEWPLYLRRANKFDWSKWFGDIIEIGQKKPNSE